MNNYFKNKVFFITGGTGSFGKALTKVLLENYKPKKIVTIPIEYRGKKIDYEIAEKRSIFLTMRNQRTNQLNKYSNILDLAIHEVTHTVCNDVRWKRDNHLPPYQSYHTLMRKWARDCGIIN